MRRLVILLGSGAFALLLLCGIGIAVLATADLRGWIESRASDETGRTVGIGSLEIAWARRTTVTVRNLTIGNAPWSGTPHMVKIDMLVAEFDLWMLLRGWARYERLTAEGVTVILERGPGHVGNWKLNDAEGGNGGLIPKNRTQVPTLMDFVLDRGRVVYRDAEADLELEVRAERFRVTAAGEEAPIRLTWRGAYNGIDGTLRAEGGSFTDLRRAELPFAVVATLTVDENQLALQGTMMEPLDFEGVSGAVQGEILNLMTLLEAVDAGISLPARGRIAGHFRRNGSRWSLTDAKGELAGTAFEGHLDFREAPRGGRDHLNVDLRLDRLDVGAVVPERAGTTDFAGTTLELGEAGSMDIAARLAARQVIWSRWSAADLDVEASRTNGEITVGTLRFATLGGGVEARGHATRGEKGVTLGATADIDRIRLDEFAGGLGTQTGGITGRLIGRMALDSAGRTAAEAVAGLNGHAILTLAEGKVPRALIERLSVDLRSLFRNDEGSSEVSCLLALLDIRAGIGRFAPLRLRTPEATVTANGRVDFLAERIDAIVFTERRRPRLFALNIPLRVTSGPGTLSVEPLAGAAPRPDRTDLAGLPPASRALAERNPCLR